MAPETRSLAFAHGPPAHTAAVWKTDVEAGSHSLDIGERGIGVAERVQRAIGQSQNVPRQLFEKATSQ
jgi:hypothetical protein